jgi:hypothetical protein
MRTLTTEDGVETVYKDWGDINIVSSTMAGRSAPTGAPRCCSSPSGRTAGGASSRALRRPIAVASHSAGYAGRRGTTRLAVRTCTRPSD